MLWFNVLINNKKEEMDCSPTTKNIRDSIRSNEKPITGSLKVIDERCRGEKKINKIRIWDWYLRNGKEAPSERRIGIQGEKLNSPQTSLRIRI